MSASKKLLVVDIAAFGWNLVSDLPEFQPAQTFFPAVTSVFQACFRTGAQIGAHGMIANGLFFKDTRKSSSGSKARRSCRGRAIGKSSALVAAKSG